MLKLDSALLARAVYLKKTVVQQIDSGKNPYILNRISHSRVAMTDGNYVTLLNFKNGDIETNKFDKTEDFKLQSGRRLLYGRWRGGSLCKRGYRL